MAQPAGRGLRPARSSGLTSPDRSAPPDSPTATPTPAPGPGTPDKPQNRRAAGSPRPDSPRKTPRAETGEVSSQLGVSVRAAGSLIGLAEDLRARLVLTREALEAGVISLAKA